MKSYLCRLRVILTIPLTGEDDPLIGYYINIGVDADSMEEASNLAKKSITDGNVDWKDSEVLEADRRAFDKDILAKRPAPQIKGAWYNSGRALFPDK